MTDRDLTLVVLAAGLGSRYGGLKQLDGVGPHGATLMDYSIYDAVRAGFTGVVCVIRPDMEEAFDPLVARWGGVGVRTAFQEPAAGRSKPWGTAHAVLAARGAVNDPFVVLNADDFYGAPAFGVARTFLTGTRSSQPVPGEWGVLTYRLRDTVPESGAVSRAICRVDAAGRLSEIVETHGITRASLPADALVSMNMWAFSPAVFDVLERGFAGFRHRAGPSDEYLLPTAINEAIRNGALVRVLEAKGTWLGVTHRADRAHVGDSLKALVAEGRYPERLW